MELAEKGRKIPPMERQLSDYVTKMRGHSNTLAEDLDGDHAGNGKAEVEPDELAKQRTCGMASRPTPTTARQFGKILQDKLQECLQNAGMLQSLRIFDDFTVSWDAGHGVPASFTECRCSQFRRLRVAAGISQEQFLASMCSKPFLGGEKEASGKSGSLFLRSHDERFLLKTIEEHEFDVLREILPNYVLYLEDNKASLLCPFYGAYSLTVAGAALRVVVMANVLRGHKPSEIYDLKGTTEDRWVDPTVHSVLKDNNFAPYTMMFDKDRCMNLRQAICNDAEFLESLGIMDYSLLVAVLDAEDGGAASASKQSQDGISGWLSSDGSRSAKVFQVGIIDYLQRWTTKKVAAHWIKKPTLGCWHEIDTEPPTIYCARFYKYFVKKIQPITAGS